MDRNVKIAKALVMVARQLIGMSTNDNGRFAKMDERYECQDYHTERNRIKIMMDSRWNFGKKREKIEKVLRGNNLWTEGNRVLGDNIDGFIVVTKNNKPVYRIVPKPISLHSKDNE